MPPSAITGTPLSAAAATHSWMAVTCGTPAPVTTRVVQIEPGPMPTLTASTPRVDQRGGALAGGDVAGDQLDVGEGLAQARAGLQHARAVAVGGVDHQDVDLGLDQRPGAIHRVGRGADRGADPQAAEIVLAGVGELVGLLDVLDGDQPVQRAVLVDHQQLLDPVAVEQRLGLLEGGSVGHRDQVLRGHQVGDRPALVGLEAQVAVGQDAAEVAVGVGDRNAGDLVVGHHLERLADRLLGAHGDRVDDHPGLASA